MVGARVVWSQITAEAGPVGEGPLFSFFFRKNKIILLFFCGQVLSVRQNGGGGCLVRASPAAPAARPPAKVVPAKKPPKQEAGRRYQKHAYANSLSRMPKTRLLRWWFPNFLCSNYPSILVVAFKLGV